MNVTKDQWIAILTFLGAVLALAATQGFIPDTIKPYIVFAVGVINLALSVFFGVAKPIAKAFVAGVQSVSSKLSASR